MGSSSYITDANGEVSQHLEYFAFGETFVEEHSNKDATPYLYNAKELDEETGLYYYGARYYDPVTSVWQSVDPLVLYDPVKEVEAYLDGQHNGGVFNSGNLASYSYTYGNPIIFVDPNGKQVLVVNGQDMNKPHSGFMKNSRTIGFALIHPSAASSIGYVKRGSTNISSVAGRFARHGAENGNMSTDINSERNALRHGVWSSMISSKYSKGTARRATDAHEGIGVGDFSKIDFSREFKSSNADMADTVVDYLNNQIGIKVGEENPGSTSTDLVKTILKEFKDNGLYTASKGDDGAYSISKTKISQKQYDTAVKTIETLNSNGFTEAEQQQINSER